MSIDGPTPKFAAQSSMTINVYRINPETGEKELFSAKRVGPVDQLPDITTNAFPTCSCPRCSPR